MKKYSSFHEGAIVRFKNPADAAERKARFVVTESKGDRVNIRLLGTKMSLPPVECVRVDEIVLANPKEDDIIP